MKSHSEALESNYWRWVELTDQYARQVASACSGTETAASNLKALAAELERSRVAYLGGGGRSRNSKAPSARLQDGAPEGDAVSGTSRQRERAAMRFVAKLFRFKAATAVSPPPDPNASVKRSERPASLPQAARREEVLSQSIFFTHWRAIKAAGITAAEFIEFLRPLADLDGISVSYVYRDEQGNERVCNHRR